MLESTHACPDQVRVPVTGHGIVVGHQVIAELQHKK